MAAPRMHHFLGAASIGYVREGANKSRTMNGVIAAPDLRLNLETLEQAKGIILQRLIQESGIEASDIKDFVWLNISYLGHMSEREFTGQPASKLSKAHQH